LGIDWPIADEVEFDPIFVLTAKEMQLLFGDS